MRLTNARRSIHDAFATHLGGPADNIGGGSVKFNSTKWLAHAGTAGLVIKAVMNQPAHLRGTCIFLNAPDITHTMNDTISMKSGLWGAFIRLYPKVSPDDQGILIAHIDRLLLGYRSRVWDAKSSAHTAGAMFADYGSKDAGRLCDWANRLLDVFASFDSKSLEPVEDVVRQERDAEAEEKKRLAESSRVVRKHLRAGKSYLEAKQLLEAANEATDTAAA